LLRVPFLEQLYEQRLGLLSWVAGIVIMALFFVSLAKTVAELLENTPSLRVLLAGQNPIQAVIGAYWFGIAVLLLAIYSITQVSRWTNEDLEGRLEMVLSNPVSRWRIVIERFLALLIAIGLLVAAGGLTTWIGASEQGINLDGAAFLRANLVLIPFGLSFGAVGAALTGRLPRVTILALSALATLSYFDWQLGPLFKWPDWVLNLSVFHLYGTPLTSGVYWPGVWLMFGITLAGFALGMIGLQRRDLGR
jgi:ABC-2 type transport system permease protein